MSSADAMAENPFDVLAQGRRVRWEGALLGLGPWLLFTALELGAAYRAVRHGESFLLEWVFWAEIILLAPTIAYLTQLSSIRMFENLWRRVPFSEVAVTPVTPEEVMEWLIRRFRRTFMIGMSINGVFGAIPFVIAFGRSLPLQTPAGLIFLFIVVGCPRMLCYLYSPWALVTGYDYLFRIPGYFKARLYGLVRVLADLVLIPGIVLLVSRWYPMLSILMFLIYLVLLIHSITRDFAARRDAAVAGMRAAWHEE